MLNKFDVNVQCDEKEPMYAMYYLSDCCGEYGSQNMDCCPACGEHCEVITEKYWVKQLTSQVGQCRMYILETTPEKSS